MHAEFISAMKTVQKSYDFHEKCTKIEKWIFLVISANFLRISLKLFSTISEKWENMFFLDGKEDK